MSRTSTKRPCPSIASGAGAAALVNWPVVSAALALDDYADLERLFVTIVESAIAISGAQHTPTHNRAVARIAPDPAVADAFGCAAPHTVANSA